MRKRIIFNLVLVAAIFYTPWWVVAPLALFGAFLCAPYYEVVAFGVLVDILYGASSFPFGGVYGLAMAIAIFFAGLYIKKIVR